MIDRAVADSGPLISFEKIPGGFVLLRRIVQCVLVPPQVLAELTAGHAADGDYRDRFSLRGFVDVMPAPPPPPALDRLHAANDLPYPWRRPKVFLCSRRIATPGGRPRHSAFPPLARWV